MCARLGFRFCLQTRVVSFRFKIVFSILYTLSNYIIPSILLLYASDDVYTFSVYRSLVNFIIRCSVFDFGIVMNFKRFWTCFNYGFAISRSLIKLMYRRRLSDFVCPTCCRLIRALNR